MANEVKIAVIVAMTLGGVVGGSLYVRDRDQKRKAATEIEKAQIIATYPPEYWNSKAEEAKAKSETEQACIASEERLKIDERNRIDAEREAKREFEKNAPAEYWEQKRIEESEKTRREEAKQIHEASQKNAEIMKHIITNTANAASQMERAARDMYGYPSQYRS